MMTGFGLSNDKAQTRGGIPAGNGGFAPVLFMNCNFYFLLSMSRNLAQYRETFEQSEANS